MAAKNEMKNVIASGENNPSKMKKIRIGQNVELIHLKRIPSVLRSKYAFYIDQPSQITNAQYLSIERLQELRRKRIMEREEELKNIKESKAIFSASGMRENNKKLTLAETEEMIKFERERHERLIGQLKAAEARNRTRIMKMRYFHSKQDEIDHLIESQPTATKAVRLEAFLPPVKQEKLKVDSTLTPIQRRRLEGLIDDNMNSLVERKLY